MRRFARDPRMNQLSNETRRAIEACMRCHAVCHAMAMTHCLETGGEHLRPQHFRLMMTCAIVCQAAADLMSHKSEYNHSMCALCARVCEACAQSCEKLSGMELCVEACRLAQQTCATHTNAAPH